MNSIKNTNPKINNDQSFLDMLWIGLKTMFEPDNTILKQDDNTSSNNLQDNIAHGVPQMTSMEIPESGPEPYSGPGPTRGQPNMIKMQGGGKCKISLVEGIIEAIDKSYDNNEKTIFEC